MHTQTADHGSADTSIALSADDFSENLFWDIDPAALDIQRHLKYVVRRVLEAGTLDDWRLLCSHFSRDYVIRVATALRSLDPKSLAFLSAVGNIPRESFRCFTAKPSTTAHWTY